MTRWTCTNCCGGAHADCSNEREARFLSCEEPERVCVCWRFDAEHSPERYAYRAPGFSADEQNEQDKFWGVLHYENWLDRSEMNHEGIYEIGG